MRAVNELEAGMVWVNAPLLDNDAGPFGGRKQSGMGRQLGSEGLDTFRHTKLSMIDHARPARMISGGFPTPMRRRFRANRVTDPEPTLTVCMPPELEARIAALEAAAPRRGFRSA